MTEPLKVAIVGTAPSSRNLAPFADPTWEIWACSAGNVDQLPRVNLWYEMHAINEMMAPENRGMSEPFFNWLKAKSEAGAFDVVMIEFNEFVPKALPYPRDEMIELFGRNWFTSTVAYMMAVAIARGATEIGLFGVDMAANEEHYSAQRAGCVRFIEIAQERGIKVHVPAESCLLTSTPMYGYWEGTPFGRRINATIQLAQAGYNNAVAQKQAYHDQIQFFGGALEQLRYFQRTWTDGAELDLNLGTLLEDIAKAKAAQPAAAPADAMAQVLTGEQTAASERPIAEPVAPAHPKPLEPAST